MKNAFFTKSSPVKTSIFLFFSLLSISAFAQDSERIPSDQYRVRFDAENPKLISVEALITLEDSLLSMSLYGPAPQWWPQYVHQLSIYDAKGDRVALESRDSTGWVVNGVRTGQQIRLSYQIKLDHEDRTWPGGIDGVAFVRHWGVMLSGRSLFVMNGGANKKDIRVSFLKPRHWTVSAPWETVEETEDEYRVNNLTQLQESLLFAGTHEELIIDRESFRLKFVLGGTSIMKEKGKYTQIATNVLDYYIELMGGVPKSAPGDKFSRILVIINQGDAIDGEVIGNDISMFLNPEANMQDQVFGWFLFAHEFFHLWNGKTLRFRDTKSEWFREGVSNYYTLKALHRVGVIDETVAKMVMNKLFYARYINDSGYGKLAPSQAASGFEKDNHWGLIYGGGLFAGICVDMQIRHNTNNARSLDHVMRYFYDQYGGTPQTIANDDILQTINDFAAGDFTAFMQAYVLGTEAVPLAKYLKYAGIKVDTSGGQLSMLHLAQKTALQDMIWRGFLGEK